MPFPTQNRRPYTKSDVQLINPNQNGCYGIFNQEACIYIGKGDIRNRMLAHINGDNPCIGRFAPTFWLNVVTTDMDNEEKRLIIEFQPTCNQKVG